MLEGLLDVLLHQQDRGFFRQPGQRPVDLFGDQRGQPEGEFIDEQQFRAAHEGPADSEHLLFTAGEGSAHLELALRQHRKELQHMFHGPLELAAPSFGVGSHFKIFRYGHVPVDTPPLGHQGQAQLGDLVGLHTRQRLALESDGPAPWRQRAGDGGQERRFAGAVASQNGHPFAQVDLERHLPEHLGLAAEYVDSRDFKHGRYSPR